MPVYAAKISYGFNDAERTHVAELYWQAFQDKLGFVLGPEPKALRFLHHALVPDFVIVARDDADRIRGMAGFHTEIGSFSGGGVRLLRRVYGSFGASWRSLLLSCLDRSVHPKVLQIDGIFVDEIARGKGIGRHLLAAIVQVAIDLDCKAVSLDVIDKNARARALYQRFGFRDMKTHSVGLLAPIFGFRKSTRMMLDITHLAQNS